MENDVMLLYVRRI